MMTKFKRAWQAFCKAWKSEEMCALPKASVTEEDLSHLRFLTLLQQSGRLLDFLKEDLSSYTDAQVGAAARKMHADCNKVVEEWITVRPIRSEEEGATITLPKGYDPHQFKLVGKIKGEPPYVGTLVHKGWKAHKQALPKNAGNGTSILQPAEVEMR